MVWVIQNRKSSRPAHCERNIGGTKNLEKIDDSLIHHLPVLSPQPFYIRPACPGCQQRFDGNQVATGRSQVQRGRTTAVASLKHVARLQGETNRNIESRSALRRALLDF